MAERQDAGVADYVDEMMHDDDDHFGYDDNNEYDDDYDGSEYYDNLSAQGDEDGELETETDDGQENAATQPNIQGESGGGNADPLALQGKSPTEELTILLKQAKTSKDQTVKSMVRSLNMAVRSATVAYIGWNIGLVYWTYWTDPAAAVLSIVRMVGGAFVLNQILARQPIRGMMEKIKVQLQKEKKRKLAQRRHV